MRTSPASRAHAVRLCGPRASSTSGEAATYQPWRPAAASSPCSSRSSSARRSVLRETPNRAHSSRSGASRWPDLQPARRPGRHAAGCITCAYSGSLPRASMRWLWRPLDILWYLFGTTAACEAHGHRRRRLPQPAIYRALVGGAADVSFDELVLHDADASRLGRITAVLDGIDAELGAHGRLPDVHRPARRGRGRGLRLLRDPGRRLEGRADRRVGRRSTRGVIGQETTGPGGIALRAAHDPGRDARSPSRSPSARRTRWLINFTNPAGMVTEAIRRVLGDRVVGICDAPPGLCRRVAAALGLPPRRAVVRLLRHQPPRAGCGRCVDRGRDLLPGAARRRRARWTAFEEGRLFGAEWLRALGMIPNEYLYYFYFAARGARVHAQRQLARPRSCSSSSARFYAGQRRRRAGGLAGRRRTSARRTYMAEAWRRRGRRTQAEIAAAARARRLRRRRPGDRRRHRQRTAAR